MYVMAPLSTSFLWRDCVFANFCTMPAESLRAIITSSRPDDFESSSRSSTGTSQRPAAEWTP